MTIAPIKFMVKIHLENTTQIFKIAWAHAKMQTAGTTLGIVWVFIRDGMNMITMIAFRLLMSGSGKVEGIHFIVYLVSALIPWYFINEVITTGVISIRRTSSIVQGMYFPAVILPTIETFAILMKKMISFMLLFIIIFIYGDIKLFNPLIFLYYLIATIIFMNAYSLLISPLITLSRDFLNLYNTLARVLFFVTPIMWSYDRIAQYKIIVEILKMNPLSYLITGFRSAVTGGTLPDIKYTLIFWGITTVTFVVASKMQYKLRKYYADFI